MDLRKWFSPVPKASQITETKNHEDFSSSRTSECTSLELRPGKSKPGQVPAPARNPFSFKEEETTQNSSHELLQTPFSTKTDDSKVNFSSPPKTPFSSKVGTSSSGPFSTPMPISRNSEEIDEDEFNLPDFIRKKNLKDINGNKFGDENYDPTTLFVPAKEKFTPAMSQYWEIKKHHFDKVLLFKLGKFYELFYLDAIRVQAILDLKWMGDDKKKTHVGFPEKALEKNSSILVQRGLKLVVVEQTETTLKNRIKKTGKCVGREITEVLSKSTIGVHYMQETFEPSYLISVIEVSSNVGFVIADFSTSEIIVGQEDFEGFLNVIAKTRPVEVLYNEFFMSVTLLKAFKSLPCKPVLSKLRNPDNWNPIKLEEYLPGRLTSEVSNLPRETTIRALVGMCSYMKDSLIFEKVLPGAVLRVFNAESFGSQFMILDRQAIEHLEILDAQGKTRPSQSSPPGSQDSQESQDSLYSFLNRCLTPFGKRLLKKWLLAPLIDPDAINMRLDAVEELMQNKDACRYFESQTSKLKDLERILARLVALGAKSNSKAVYFENVSSNQLIMFVNFLKDMKKMENLSSCLDSCGLESTFLLKIARFQDEGGQFPRVDDLCNKFIDLVKFKKEDCPEPAPGYCIEYDLVKEEVKAIEQELQEELLVERAKFGNNQEIKFVDSKFRYELEVPVYLVKKSKPAGYEETTARQGFQRYYTKDIKRLADNLEITEEKLKNQLRPFLGQLLSEFLDHHEKWKKIINLIAEFDCLLSLAKVSTGNNFPMTRPCFSDFTEELVVNSLHHPILASRVTSFIPNHIRFDAQHRCYVLTGPNMGGKSTVLRKVCIAVIMAQIGCFVPAEFMKFCTVDRIFTRLGAKDSLVEGKSTFAVEMEEASKFFKLGTVRSLVIMDELGRGTSTDDGSALALAVLKGLAIRRARTFFTTHYHILLEDIKKINGVTLMHMNSYIEVSSKKLIFLYKLVEGECPKSYGIIVARMAGIPDAILNRAQVVAEKIEEKEAKILQLRKNLYN
jgi:DNA mismatch repair protein MSH6